MQTRKRKPETKAELWGDISKLAAKLGGLTALAADINDNYWSDKLKLMKLDALRTLATYFKQIGFGGAHDPSHLHASIIRELARRRTVKADPKRSRRRT